MKQLISKEYPPKHLMNPARLYRDSRHTDIRLSRGWIIAMAEQGYREAMKSAGSVVRRVK